MITADPMPVFPTCPTFGFTVTPSILVKVISRESGNERLDRKWALPLRQFTAVPIGPRPQADLEALQNFWLAIGGISTYFRFTDWTDYQSCPLDSVPSALDQLLGADVGSPPVGFQLEKTYTAGTLSMIRPITRPIGSTVMIANESGQVQDPSTWTLDESTGIFVPNGGFVGTPGSWGGQFHVPLRFKDEPQFEITDHLIQGLNQAATFVESRLG
jgi:uncharacterized protein (TIGR02217 family)